MRPWIVLAILLAGCLSADSDASGPAASDVPTAGSEPELSKATTRTIQHEFSGVQSRTGISDTQTWTGDAPEFCFEVPRDVRFLNATLSWAGPQQMGLEFHPAAAPAVHSWDEDDPTTLYGASPITISLVAPGSGVWYAYAGPGAAGVQIEWSLNLGLLVGAQTDDADAEAPVDCSLRG